MIAESVLSRKIVSCIYLTGDGFDGGWLHESLKLLCRGRKTFIGKNLYSKGACYAAVVKSGLIPWNFVYLGDNVVKLNVSLKVYDKGQMAFYPLISAGESWFEAEGSAQVILDGKAEIDFWLQEADSREAKIRTLILSDFPEREARTSRLWIRIRALNDRTFAVRIRDLGFGEIAKAGERTWEYTLNAED